MRHALPFAGVVAAFGISPLAAHDFYPAHCCGGKDCKQVSCELIIHKDNGYEYTPTHNNFNSALPSLDGYCHVCIANTISRCLFLGGAS
jgi:hypothetical protein